MAFGLKIYNTRWQHKNVALNFKGIGLDGSKRGVTELNGMGLDGSREGGVRLNVRG